MKPKQHIKTTAKRIGSFERRIGKIPEGNTYITNPYGGYTSLSHKIDQELSIQGSSPVNINNNISNIQNSANSYNVNINKVTKQITQLETDLKKWEQDLAKELKKKDSSGEKIVHLASSRKLFSRLNNTDINHRISTDSHNINGISSSYSDMLSSTTMHINNLLSTKRTKSSIGKTYDTQISYIDRTTRSGLLYGNTQKNSEYLKEFYLSMDSKKWHEYKSLLHRLIGDVTTKELLEKDMAKSCLVLAKHYKELENRSYDQIKEYIKLQIQNDYEKSKIDREITKISDFNYHFSKYISKEQTTNEYTTRTLENLKADHQNEIINTVNDEMQKNLEKTTKSAEIISDMRLQQIEDRLKTDISKYIDIEISALTKSGSMASSIESSIDYNSEVVEKTIYNDKLVNSENFRSFITELIKKEINHGIKYQSTNDVSNLVDLISTEILNKYIKHEFLVTAGAVIKSRVNNNALLESYIEKHIQDNSVVSKSLTQYLINSDPEVQKNFMKYVYDAVYNNVRGIDISNQTNTSINSSDKSINMDLSNESKNNSDIEVSISEQSSNESNTQFSSGNNSISSINSRIANILSNIRTSSNSNEVANNVSGSRVNSNISVNSESEYSNDSITLDELEIYDILNSFIFDENEEVFTKVISSIDNHIIKEELYKSITNMIEETIDVETGKIDSEYVQIAIDYGLSDVLNVFAKKSNTNSVIESVFNIYSEMDNYLSNSYESLNAKQELQSNKNQYNSNSLRKQSIENTYISDSVGNASRTNIANSANVEKSLNIANESNITNDIEDIVESVQFEEIIDSIEFGDQIDYNELEDILSIIKSYATHNKRISGSQVFSARSLSVFNPTHNTTSTYMGEFSPISYYRGTLSYGLSNSSSFETDLNTNIYDMIQKRLDLMSNSLIHNFEFAGDRLNLINTGLFNSSKSINNSYSTIFNMVENTIGKHILSHSKKLSTSINKRYIKVIDNLNARGQLDQQFINSVTTLNNYTTDSMLQSILNGDKSINSNILNSITNRIAKQNIVDKTLSNNLISNNFKSDNWISNSMLSNSFVSYNLLSNTNLLDKFINTTVNIKNSSINKLESSDLGSRSYFDNNNFNNNSYNNINNNNNIGNNWYNSNNSNSNTYNNLNSISSSDITNLSQNNLTTLLRTYFNYSSIVNNSEMMKNEIYNSSFVNSVLGNKSNILKTNSIFYSFARNLYDVDFSKDTTNELYQIERVDNLTKTLNKISQTMREGNEEIKSYKIIPYKRAEMILKTLTDLKQIEQTMVQNAVDSLSSVGNNITINSPNLRNNYMMNLSNVFSYLTNYTNSQTDERVTNYNKVLRNINNLFNSKSSLNNIEKLISRSNSLNKSSNFNNLNNSNNSNNLSITSISNKLSRLNSLNHTSNMQNLNSLTNLGNLSNLSNMTSLSNSSTLSQLTGLFNLSNAISSDNISNSTGFIINPKFTGLMQKLSSSLKVNLMSVSPNLLTPISVGLNIKDSSISLSSSRPIFLNTEQGMTFITENNLYQASKLFNKQVSDVLSSAVSSKFMDAKKAVFTELNISENNYRNFDSYINYIVDNSKSFEEVSLRYEEKSEENSGELIKKIQKQNEIITELREEISVIKDTEHNVKINIDRLSEDIMRQLIDKTKKERQRRGGF